MIGHLKCKSTLLEPLLLRRLPLLFKGGSENPFNQFEFLNNSPLLMKTAKYCSSQIILPSSTTTQHLSPDWSNLRGVILLVGM